MRQNIILEISSDCNECNNFRSVIAFNKFYFNFRNRLFQDVDKCNANIDVTFDFDDAYDD